MEAPQDVNPELEHFREQWRAEVRARNTTSSTLQQQGSVPIYPESSRDPVSRPPGSTHLSAGKPKVADTDEDYVEARTFDDPEPVQPKKQAEQQGQEPVTALDHYECAVEKETQGSLGDSLMLYRKAFRVRITTFWPAFSLC